jgi:hypothetical protein
MSIGFGKLFNHPFGKWVFSLHDIAGDRGFDECILFQPFSDREKSYDAPRNSPLNSLPMSSESFSPNDGPKKSPMQSARSNGPCLVCMASILSNSGAIDPVAEPVTSLGSINDSKRVRTLSSYILRAGGVEVMTAKDFVHLLSTSSRRELLI